MSLLAGPRGGSSVSSGGGGSVRDMIASLNKPEPLGGTVVIGGGSVRDRIANMNKSVAAGGGGVASTDTTDGPKRKGNSLPRNAESSSSPSCRPKNSPKNLRKESTTDDPRILKLDDDFMYEDTVNV